MTVPWVLGNIQGDMGGNTEVQAWWLVSFPREGQRFTGWKSVATHGVVQDLRHYEYYHKHHHYVTEWTHGGGPDTVTLTSPLLQGLYTIILCPPPFITVVLNARV